MKTKYLFYHKVLLGCIGLIFISLSLNGQVLNGEYTIGGQSPDYQTINLAVEDLNLYGIDGAVTFKIRAGNYIEQFRIYEISGSSENNTITFQSESGNPEDVIIRHIHFGWWTDVNYTLFIDGADFLVFKNLTLQADPENPSAEDNCRVIYITNNSNNITFENNNINSWYTEESYFEYNDCIFIGSDYNTDFDNDSIRFSNNTIFGGNAGLRFQGSSSAGDFHASHWIVEDNLFLEQHDNGLVIGIGMNSKITGNKIYAERILPSFKGIEIYQHSDSLLIDQNYIHLIGGGWGIYIANVVSGEADFKQIINNSISIGPEYWILSCLGIKSKSNESILVAYNTVNIFYQSSNGYCVYSSYDDILHLYNNNLVNHGGGPVYFSNNNDNGEFISDYNNVYTEGDILADINGVQCTSLAGLYNQFGTDESSISENPYFLNDLILIPYNINCFETGNPIPGIDFDFFGNLRSIIAPDVGIFEGSVPDFDAGLTGSSSGSGLPCPEDTVLFYVTLKNYGLQPLTSALISCTIADTIFAEVTWTGNLLQFQEDDNVYVGDIILAPLEQTVITSWCSLPNGEIDPQPYNDTIQSSVATAMAGEYSIGLGNTDFTTLNEAMDILIDQGICSAVTFNIKPGIYPEQIEIPPIDGASVENTITFQSESQDSTSVIIQYVGSNNDDNYVIKLDGSQHIHIKHLKLNAPANSYRTALLLTDGASDNVFESNILNSSYSTSSNPNSALVRFKGNSEIPMNNNKFENCRIQNSGYQVLMEETDGNFSYGNLFINNIFEGQCYGSMMILEEMDLTISDNLFSGDRSGQFSGISLESCGQNILIEKNIFEIDGNEEEIGIDDCQGTNIYPLVIKNNFFTLLSNYSGNILWMQDASYVNIFNNNFNLAGSDGAVAYFGHSLSHIKVLNNIFYTPDDGKLYSTSYEIDPENFLSDYNAFYTTGESEFRYLSEYISFTDWQSQTGQDSNSIFTDPLYVSETDLHINNAYAINGSGMPLEEVEVDIDYEPRDSLFPDIGADEFDIDSTSYYDIELVDLRLPDISSCLQSDSIVLRIANNSIFPIDTLTYQWRLFNFIQDSIVLIQTIPSKDTIDIVISDFQFNHNTYYELFFEISKPNGHDDNKFENNQLFATYYHLKNVEIFKTHNPECGPDIELYIKKFPNESILWSTGSTENKIIVSLPGEYTVQVTDDKGCEVEDSIIIE